MAKVDSAAFLSRLERLYSHWEVRLRRWAIFGVGFRSKCILEKLAYCNCEICRGHVISLLP